MSRTEGEEHEPYTITRVTLRWRHNGLPLGVYKVFYSTFRWKESATLVEAKDELDAFTKGLKKLETLKRKAERMRDRKKEQTND